MVLIKYIVSSVYLLDLSNDVDIHPNFHVSSPKELMGSDNTIITSKVIVTHQDLSSTPHFPKKIN